jgi:hypothetical protein
MTGFVTSSCVPQQWLGLYHRSKPKKRYFPQYMSIAASAMWKLLHTAMKGQAPFPGMSASNETMR